jgi:hypothetical protein
MLGRRVKYIFITGAPAANKLRRSHSAPDWLAGVSKNGRKEPKARRAERHVDIRKVPKFYAGHRLKLKEILRLAMHSFIIGNQGFKK